MDLTKYTWENIVRTTPGLIDALPDIGEGLLICEFAMNCSDKGCNFIKPFKCGFKEFECSHSRDFNPSGIVHMVKVPSIEEADAIMESLQ